MIATIKLVDADGEHRELSGGHADWETMISGDRHFGTIHYVVLDVIPMALVMQSYV